MRPEAAKVSVNFSSDLTDFVDRATLEMLSFIVVDPSAMISISSHFFRERDTGRVRS
jgi:hypothetical protein